ncbi:YceI family protein [Thiopseudomonas acetoxidans]|uniref:YceI family protein n=1 Tax=Thiopseudomonas acetoxidans TaxID=3041622 RepID=A0ABT7SN57_9GAMM|nr:YceI family protein [Thiopseudomonas sp. CY1220]MCK9238496.1 YceI family protein [Thiopseudomonas sp.]MCK9464422.1 YceI family protein [Thiopseudomonas sp.]MDM7857611.1 YceI family protein [Thiopseudomonas sp. CY1220]
MKNILTPVLLAIISSTAAYADTYKLDPDHSNARFAIGHFGTSTNHGGFYNLTGDITVDPQRGTGQLKVIIPVASVNTGNQQFNEHLKNADLFNVEQFPTMTFASTEWNYVDGMPQQVTGDLSLLGVSHPVTLTATQFNCYQSPMFDGATVCGGDFEAVIDRSQWGMDYLVELGIPKEVKLSIQVEAVKQ